MDDSGHPRSHMDDDDRPKSNGHTRSILVPWSAVEGIFQTQGDTMQLILLALPSPPVVVSTSKLLRAVFPKQSFGETTISFYALRLYMVCWFYFKGDMTDNPLMNAVEERLQKDQTEALAAADADDPAAFNLTYLHAYEVALVKCMHLKLRTATATATDDNPDTQEVLEMTPETVLRLGILSYLTPRSPPTNISDEDAETVRKITKQQQDLQKDMDHVFGTTTDETTALDRLAQQTTQISLDASPTTDETAAKT
jgi:hypothetical protein